MTGHDKPLTPDRIAAVKDEDIDFSDIPELDESFWREAERVEPDPTEQIAVGIKRLMLKHSPKAGKG